MLIFFSSPHLEFRSDFFTQVLSFWYHVIPGIQAGYFLIKYCVFISGNCPLEAPEFRFIPQSHLAELFLTYPFPLVLQSLACPSIWNLQLMFLCKQAEQRSFLDSMVAVCILHNLFLTSATGARSFSGELRFHSQCDSWNPRYRHVLVF